MRDSVIRAKCTQTEQALQDQKSGSTTNVPPKERAMTKHSKQQNDTPMYQYHYGHMHIRPQNSRHAEKVPGPVSAVSAAADSTVNVDCSALLCPHCISHQIRCCCVISHRKTRERLLAPGGLAGEHAPHLQHIPATPMMRYKEHPRDTQRKYISYEKPNCGERAN